MKGVVKWADLGLELKLYKPTLQTIDVNKRGDVGDCKREMFSQWLCWVDGVTEKTCTWRCLATALRAVGHEPIAKNIEETYDIPIIQ